MIIFGAITYLTDTQVGSQMVIGGVGLITIILTAYTGFAAFEDTMSRKYEGENPDG
jgi:uncharacterized BrkB/YihY/UPF0761 family membrane protein